MVDVKLIFYHWISYSTISSYFGMKANPINGTSPITSMNYSISVVAALNTPVDCTSARYGKNCSYVAFKSGSASWRVTYFYTGSPEYINQRPAL